jgi:hypothetical protein
MALAVSPVRLRFVSELMPSADTPTYVIYHELIFTSKEYMTQVTSVDAFWLGAPVPLRAPGCIPLTRRPRSRARLCLLLRPRKEFRRAREPAQDRPRILAEGRDRDGDGAESRGVGVGDNVVRASANWYLQG